MKTTAATLLSIAGLALADGVYESIAPQGSYPSGCQKDFSSKFEVTVSAVKNAKRDLVQKRSGSCGGNGILLVSLENGVLTDSENRTGYIASNFQFQFDAPPQSGAMYTAGFSLCGNDSLALGSTTAFWQCKSGDFWNLYDRNWAEQCSEVQLIAMPCDGSSSAGKAGESGDGQIVATAQITTTIIKPIADGQPQVITTTIPQPICQITDGQAQVQTIPCASITSIATHATPTTTAVPISQFSDGQIQVTTPATTETTVILPSGGGGEPSGTAVTTTPAVPASTTTRWTAASNSTAFVASSRTASSVSTPTSSTPAATSIVASDSRRIVANTIVAAFASFLCAFVAL